VKIRGTCKRDGREFMVEQVIASGGKCPWDGEPFNADYAVTLVDALRDAEQAGSRLEVALEAIASLDPEFRLSVDSVLGFLRSQIDKLDRGTVRRG
jgi:hypothetical protein